MLRKGSLFIFSAMQNVVVASVIPSSHYSTRIRIFGPLPLISPVTKLSNRIHLVIMFVVSTDNAISLVKSNASYAEGRCTAFVCDLVKDQVPEAVSRIDVAFMVFFLSALSPATMRTAVEKVAYTMNEGAILLFRDYARYDLAQLRFDKKSRYYVPGRQRHVDALFRLLLI